MSPRVRPRVLTRFDYTSSSQEGKARASAAFSWSKAFDGTTMEEAMKQAADALLVLQKDLAIDVQANLGGKEVGATA